MKSGWKNSVHAVWILSLLLLCGCTAGIPASVQTRRNIEYARVGNHSLKLDLYQPKEPQGKLPVLVWIHGGAWNSGSKDACPIAFLASKMAVVSIDYRLVDAAPFPAQLQDCKGAIRWLRAHAADYSLDPDRIGILGASAGGHLALLLATTPDHATLEGDVGGNVEFSSRVQCVCAFYPPTELNLLVANPKWRSDPAGDVARLLGGAVDQNVDKAIAASPLSYVDAHCAPVFLMHGGADPIVPAEQSRIFYEALRKDGVDAHLEIIPHQGHGITATRTVAKEIYEFYAKYLGLKTRKG